MAKASSRTGTQRVQRKAIKLAQAYTNVFKSKDGNLVVADLMAKFNIMRPTYKQGATLDVHAMLVEEGSRSAVLYILQMLNIDLEQLRERIEQNAEIINADE